jgi:hemolysin III
MHRYGLDHSLPEHIADGVMHAVGVVAAIAGATALLVWAALAVPVERIWPLIPYAAALVASFALSAAYNMTLHRRIRAVLRRFDHAAIYLLIAGTYTPMAIIGLGGGRGLALAIAAWSLAVFGIVLKLGFFHRWPKLGFALYLGQGWLGLVAAWPLVQTLPLSALILIVAGGLTFSLGTIFYASSWRFSRAIWHGHVLAAAAAHYAAIILVTRLAA